MLALLILQQLAQCRPTQLATVQNVEGLVFEGIAHPNGTYKFVTRTEADGKYLKKEHDEEVVVGEGIVLDEKVSNEKYILYANQSDFAATSYNITVSFGSTQQASMNEDVINTTTFTVEGRAIVSAPSNIGMLATAIDNIPLEYDGASTMLKLEHEVWLYDVDVKGVRHIAVVLHTNTENGFYVVHDSDKQYWCRIDSIKYVEQVPGDEIEKCVETFTATNDVNVTTSANNKEYNLSMPAALFMTLDVKVGCAQFVLQGSMPWFDADIKEEKYTSQCKKDGEWKTAELTARDNDGKVVLTATFDNSSSDLTLNYVTVSK